MRHRSQFEFKKEIVEALKKMSLAEDITPSTLFQTAVNQASAGIGFLTKEKINLSWFDEHEEIIKSLMASHQATKQQVIEAILETFLDMPKGKL